MVDGDSVLLGGASVLQSTGKLDQREAKMKFTDGPWFFIESAAFPSVRDSYGNVLADVYGNSETVIATTRLISASPDIYKALKTLTILIEPIANAGGLTQIWLDALNRAKAALRKAEGE